MTSPWTNTELQSYTRGDSTLIDQRWRQLVGELQTALNSYVPELLLGYCDKQTAVYGHYKQLLLDDSLMGHDYLTRLFERLTSLGLTEAVITQWEVRGFGKGYDMLELTLTCHTLQPSNDIKCQLALLIRADEQNMPKVVALFDLEDTWQKHAAS